MIEFSKLEVGDLVSLITKHDGIKSGVVEKKMPDSIVMNAMVSTRGPVPQLERKNVTVMFRDVTMLIVVWPKRGKRIR